jgi:hypothetical protein
VHRCTHQQPILSDPELISRLLLSLTCLQAVLCRDWCLQDPDPFRTPGYPASEPNANKGAAVDIPLFVLIERNIDEETDQRSTQRRP